jgi:hypothetical protein
MSEGESPQKGRHFFKVFALFELTIFAVVGLVCWLGNLLTIQFYSTGLIIAGVLFLVIEAYGTFGMWGTTRDFNYLYGGSVSEKPLSQQTARDMKEEGDWIGEFWQQSLIGLLPIVVAVLLQLLFR